MDARIQQNVETVVHTEGLIYWPGVYFVVLMFSMSVCLFRRYVRLPQICNFVKLSGFVGDQV